MDNASAGRLEAGKLLPVELCVPPGRQPFDVDAERVHVVTLLSASAFDVLRQTGSVAATPEVVPVAGDVDGFAAAYDWMRWQMALHVDGYAGGFPIWVWGQIRPRWPVQGCIERIEAGWVSAVRRPR